MAPATYGKTWWREGYACGCMIMSIEDIVEPRLREAGYLGAGETVNIFQQAYSSSVSASAGTHAGGGALDHQKGSDGETKIWRECGWADWQRGSPQDSAFDDHNHGIVQGCPHLSGDAEGQVTQYKQGCNGLADWGPDQSPHVAPITWQAAYDKYKGKEGLWGMTEIIKPHRSKDQQFTGNDTWQTVRIDDDDGFTFVTGPSDGYLVVACFVHSGLAVGDVCQFRFQAVKDYPDSRPTEVEYHYPITESIATSGNTYGQIVWANDLGGDTDGAKRRLRLFISPPKDKKVTLIDLTSRVFRD
jgi:hypothetical protein